MPFATFQDGIPPGSSPEGTLASGSVDKTVIIWDVESGKQKAKLRGHTDYVQSVAWGPGNLLASGSEDNTIIIWDGVSGEQKPQLRGHTNYVTSVAWGPERLPDRIWVT